MSTGREPRREVHRCEKCRREGEDVRYTTDVGMWLCSPCWFNTPPRAGRRRPEDDP